LGTVRATVECLVRRPVEERVRTYGEDWWFEVVDGSLVHANDSRWGDPGSAHVFAVVPGSVFGIGFGTGEPYSQTCFTFPWK
jgi:hypothetical protein